MLTRRVRWPRRSPHRSVSRTLALLAVGTVLVAGCGDGGSDFSTPVGRYLSGTLAGDAGSRCVWIVPGDPGHTGEPVEIRLPSTVAVRFAPALTVSAGGRTLRAGDAVSVQDLGPTDGRPGCPLPAGHVTIDTGPSGLRAGLITLNPPPPRSS